ncbi:MAG: HlyD family secretion protein [Pseudomonadota bacterium]
MINALCGAFAATLVVLVWYLFADRITPFTSNARLKAVITPITPQVSGPIIDVAIVNRQAVDAGALVAKIDPRSFEIARDRAQADLEAATQAVGVSSAEVERAQAQLVRARGDLENVQLQTRRVLELERKDVVTVARADEARTLLADAEGALDIAKADLERAQENLGPEGADNPRTRAALADLARAELDIGYTELRAPAYGGVVDLAVSEGAQAVAGQPLMTFVDGRDIWVEAYMTENNIGAISVGAAVEIVLDVAPGRVLDGRVESITTAASDGTGGQPDGLPTPPSPGGWLRAPQRFPVRITITGYEAGSSEDDLRLNLNGQADVIDYTGDNWMLNTLGAGYIRSVAWLSYAY